MRRATTLWLGFLLLVGCGPITKEDVARMKNEVRFAKRDLASARKSIKPLEDYVADLEQGKLSGQGFLMVSPGDILKAAKKAFIPYKFPAKSIHKKISGTFITKKVLDVEMLPSNKLQVSLLLVGKKIKVHYKGKLYKPHIKKIKAALQKGMEVKLVVDLKLAKTRKSVVARVRCKDVQLKAHNESTYRSNIKGAINKTLGKKKYVIPLPPRGGFKPLSLFTTGHHVVVKYE